HPGLSIVGAAGLDISPYFPRVNPETLQPLWGTCQFITVSSNATLPTAPPVVSPPTSSVTTSPTPVTGGGIISRRQQLVTFDNATNAFCTQPTLPDTPAFCHDAFGIEDLIKANRISVYRVGVLAWDVSQIKSHYLPTDSLTIINGKVYNFTALFSPTSPYVLDPNVFTLDQLGSPGGDASVNSTYFRGAMDCFDHLFLVGFVDKRTSDAGCNASAYILYGVTGVMVAVLVVKFLTALQLAPQANPEKNDRFVIMQVPCYNEGEGSLLKTIESLAVFDYDDTRKLLCVVSDGMVRSAGSDMPTPDIVLKILGVDKSIQQPEPKSYLAIGRGLKEHNKAKVYSGLYAIQARYIPFIVIVKVGKEGETEKPGNRGKRDSQMILMKFLNRVNFGTPMTPLELELYHHIKNVIGVDPFLYEYVLMVDADTKVEAQSLNRLISCMVHDANTMGICGETQIENEKESWVTMMQVYEYYISHHLAKAFESLFGSVTCLPGCFCMYRLRTPKKVPLLIANQILSEYQDINVNTLHKQNLLSLGEDRFLTTLMLKHFPEYRNKFTPDAVCYTIVPDTFQMLLGQRRRWINSTIHNLFELVFLPTLCGCLCFSMRLVVFLDLFATMVMPAATAYLGYLIYASVEAQQAPMISLIMLGAAYGLQILIFLLKHQYQHIGWLIISIIAMPVFSLWLPLYAYWHFDDFKWGNTRKGASAETGDTGHGGVDEELEHFDKSTVPLFTWDEYQAILAKSNQNNLGHGHSLESTAASTNHPLSAVEQSLGSAAFNVPPSEYRGSAYGRMSNYGASQPAPALQHKAASLLQGETNSIRESSAAQQLQKPYTPQRMPSGQNVPITMEESADPNVDKWVAQSLETSNNNGDGDFVPVAPPWAGGYPSDEEILRHVQFIIGTSDLSLLTKKKVREAVSAYFGVDLNEKKALINEHVELLIQTRM
ncbi:hypothetical protein HDU76_012211, partial [Blyttiomyces sp. JEL0837]